MSFKNMNVVKCLSCKRKARKFQGHNFKQWTMKKTLVDQLHPITVPSPTPDYQDEYGGHDDKMTTKNIG
jgi:hypothetical protein